MNSPKPVVTYQYAHHIALGDRAILTGVKGHPSSDVTGGAVATSTSKVIAIRENGAFETLNTLYVKEEG